MANSIKIVNGKKGYHLMVNGLYINDGFSSKDRERIISIKNENGVPYGATEWVSVNAIRNFWHKYMPLIIHSTTKPYRSVWGRFSFISEIN